jgi:hypothetical protein
MRILPIVGWLLVAVSAVASARDSVYKDRRRLVDLGDEKERLLDSVALVARTGKRWEEGRGWGSGFLVSKCHALTANHVVFHHDSDPAKDEPMRPGKEVLVGLGQLDRSPWKKTIVTGKVVGYDPAVRVVTRGGTRVLDAGRDWALVRLPRDERGTHLGERYAPFCIPERNRLSDATRLVLKAVGQPADMLTFRTRRLSLWMDPGCGVLGAGENHWVVDCQLRKGMSGGPIARYDDERKCWAAFAISSVSAAPHAGLAARNEQDLSRGNHAAPVGSFNLQKILQAMRDNPCD